MCLIDCHCQILAKLHSVFTKVWKIKYSNVHLFAVLLYDLGRYHPDFSVSVIDEILENIRAGMEVRARYGVSFRWIVLTVFLTVDQQLQVQSATCGNGQVSW